MSIYCKFCTASIRQQHLTQFMHPVNTLYVWACRKRFEAIRGTEASSDAGCHSSCVYPDWRPRLWQDHHHQVHRGPVERPRQEAGTLCTHRLDLLAFCVPLLTCHKSAHCHTVQCACKWLTDTQHIQTDHGLYQGPPPRWCRQKCPQLGGNIDWSLPELTLQVCDTFCCSQSRPSPQAFPS